MTIAAVERAEAEKEISCSGNECAIVHKGKSDGRVYLCIYV